MPDPTLDELRAALDHATTEAKRWRTIANVLAERVRELAKPAHTATTPLITVGASSCVDDGDGFCTACPTTHKLFSYTLVSLGDLDDADGDRG